VKLYNYSNKNLKIKNYESRGKKLMKAREKNLLEFLKEWEQFKIPIYQHTYSWTEKECKQLWKDILEAGEKNYISSHFIGFIVYRESEHNQIYKSFDLIDGQQRLTTLCLILKALEQQLSQHTNQTESLDGLSKEELRKYYLIKEKKPPYKLLLTQTDKESLEAILDGYSCPEEHSIKIKENFEFFEKKVKKLDHSEIKFLWEGLKKLIIVYVSLDPNTDKPQVIFESMNSTGKELSQTDLIRNFVLMDLPETDQEKLYEDWQIMEERFEQKTNSEYFDGFIRDYLTIKTNKIPKKKEVYEDFKKYADKKGIYANKERLKDIVKDLKKFSEYYCSIVLDKEENKNLKEAFSDLGKLKATVSYPFLLRVYDDYKKDLLTDEDFRYVIRLVENYVFRRAVCDIPTNSLNKTFAKFSENIKKEAYIESIEAHFLNQSSYCRFPRDDEFLKKIQNRDLYNFRSQMYWLRKLEHYGTREKVILKECTIEHILPQNKNLSREWKEAIGENWKKIQDTYLHTLGNLTLTTYNSELGDKPFTEKKEIFKESRLRLNKKLGDLDTWNENTIKERTKELANEALEVWFAPPSHPSEILDKYKPKQSRVEKTSYTIESYPQLSKKNLRELFTTFQKEVLALDPCISEEFLKHYIAYKAENNFVCVVPQSNRLRLSLKLKIQELDDPKEIVRDISNIGKLGTGDVGFYLNSLKELPYAVGLIRQALDKQIGNDIE